MSKRKTVNVTDMVTIVNDMCKRSGADASGIRQGMMFMLEHFLHDTWNYKGYRYLLANEVEDGLPGVNYDVNMDGVMIPHPDYEKRFANTDKTRVEYFK
jgi:hypothetical protein